MALQKDFVYRNESFKTQPKLFLSAAKLFFINCLHTYIKTYLESLNDICVTVSIFIHQSLEAAYYPKIA